MARSRIMYIENKSGSLNGPAQIGRVLFSKTFHTIYYGGMTFKIIPGGGFKANWREIESGEEYWISGCRKDGADRLYVSRVPIEIDEDVRREYWCVIRGKPECKDRATV